MSFIAEALKRNEQNDDEIPWWFKYAARGLGIVGGIVAMAMGVFRCVTLSAICMVSGIWQVLAGFLVLLIEAPCCCLCLDFIQSFSDFVDRRPLWHRAALYLGVALPPIFLCASLSTIIGNALVVATAILYGLMTIGKKASRSEMMSRAAAEDPGLVKNMELPVPNQPTPA